MKLGYKLWREIKPLFPAGTTPAERVVGLLVADDAHEVTRISTRLPTALLCAMSGLSERGLRDAFQRLLTRGLEFRVALYESADGRPIYASRNHEPRFRVPTFEEFMAVIPPLEGGTAVPPSRLLSPVDRPP